MNLISAYKLIKSITVLQKTETMNHVLIVPSNEESELLILDRILKTENTFEEYWYPEYLTSR